MFISKIFLLFFIILQVWSKSLNNNEPNNPAIKNLGDIEITTKTFSKRLIYPSNIQISNIASTTKKSKLNNDKIMISNDILEKYHLFKKYDKKLKTLKLCKISNKNRSNIKKRDINASNSIDLSNDTVLSNSTIKLDLSNDTVLSSSTIKSDLSNDTVLSSSTIKSDLLNNTIQFAEKILPNTSFNINISIINTPNEKNENISKEDISLNNNMSLNIIDFLLKKIFNITLKDLDILDYFFNKIYSSKINEKLKNNNNIDILNEKNIKEFHSNEDYSDEYLFDKFDDMIDKYII